MCLQGCVSLSSPDFVIQLFVFTNILQTSVFLLDMFEFYSQKAYLALPAFFFLSVRHYKFLMF